MRDGPAVKLRKGERRGEEEQKEGKNNRLEGERGKEQLARRGTAARREGIDSEA